MQAQALQGPPISANRHTFAIAGGFSQPNRALQRTTARDCVELLRLHRPLGPACADEASACCMADWGAAAPSGLGADIPSCPSSIWPW